MAVGMMLDRSPFLGRTCNDCLRYLYDDDGKVKKNKRNGKPVLRPKDTRPPCFKCPKVIGDGQPDSKSYYDAEEVTASTWEAIQYYEECVAVGEFPKGDDGEIDPLVRRFASKIKRMRDNHDKEEQRAMLMSLSLERLFK